MSTNEQGSLVIASGSCGIGDKTGEDNIILWSLRNSMMLALEGLDVQIYRVHFVNASYWHKVSVMGSWSQVA